MTEQWVNNIHSTWKMDGMSITCNDVYMYNMKLKLTGKQCNRNVSFYIIIWQGIHTVIWYMHLLALYSLKNGIRLSTQATTKTIKHLIKQPNSLPQKDWMRLSAELSFKFMLSLTPLVERWSEILEEEEMLGSFFCVSFSLLMDRCMSVKDKVFMFYISDKEALQNFSCTSQPWSEKYILTCFHCVVTNILDCKVGKIYESKGEKMLT